MIVVFDPAKDAANLAKHGVPLVFGTRVFEDVEHVVLPSLRPVDGEDRYKAIGMVEERLWTAVFVERDGVTRLISVRKSNASEQGNYHRHPG